MLNVFYDRYQCPIYITENGVGYFDKLEADGTIHDPYRVEYFKAHIEQMKEAIRDGVDLRGYYAWGPIDIISCSSSEMSKRYGFVYVDQDDYGKGSGRRIKKGQFAWYQHVIEDQRGRTVKKKKRTKGAQRTEKSVHELLLSYSVLQKIPDGKEKSDMIQ